MHQNQLIYWILISSYLIPHVSYGSGLDMMEEPLYNSKPIWQMDGDSSWEDETSAVLQFICANVLLWLFLVWLYFWNSRELTLSVFLLLFIVKMGGVLLPFWWIFPNIFRSGHSSQVIPPKAELEDTQAFNCLQTLYISNVMVLFLSLVVLHLRSKENRKQLTDIGQTVMLNAASVISAAVSAICSALSLRRMLVKTPANQKTQPTKRKKERKKHKRVRIQTEPQPPASMEPRDSVQNIMEPIESVQDIMEPEDSNVEKVVLLYPANTDIRQEILLEDGLTQVKSELGHEAITSVKPCIRNGCIYNKDMNISVLTSVSTESQTTEDVHSSRKKIGCFFRLIERLRDTRKKNKTGKCKKLKILKNLTSCFRQHSMDSDDP